MSLTYPPDDLYPSRSVNVTLATPIDNADMIMRLEWPLLRLKLSLAFLGLTCNVFVFIGLCAKNKRMRTADVLLLNLTAWDVVFLSSRASQHITRLIYNTYDDVSTCRVIFIIYFIFTYIARSSFITAMISMIPIAVERCMYIFRPVVVVSFNNGKRIKFALLIVIILSAFISFPEILVVACVIQAFPENIDAIDQTAVSSVCTSTSFDAILKSSVLSRLTCKIVTWITLLILDSILIYRLVSGARLVRRMYDGDSGHMHHHRGHSERSLTVAVASTILIALLAHPVTGLLWAMAYENHGLNGLVDPRVMTKAQGAGRVVQLINASQTLFFLLLFGTRFRRNLRSRLCPCIVDTHYHQPTVQIHRFRPSSVNL